MAAVRETNLHRFKGRYVVDKLCAGSLPLGPAAGEVVLDRSLTEGFRHYGHTSLTPKLSARKRRS